MLCPNGLQWFFHSVAVEMVDHLACLARSMVWHERLIGGINVESPACGAQSKTTVVCKLQWKYDKKFWLFVIL